MDSSEVNYCVVVPTYNNASTLKTVLDSLLSHTSEVIVVNDGSTDHTAEILGQYANLDVIIHLVNQGKGMALRNAFELATRRGFEYAITIDSDGQHNPGDLPAVLGKIAENRGKVVMGSRAMEGEGIPKKSSFGNRFSNFWFWAETGIRLADTQTGFRAYPLKSMLGMKWFTHRFEFEIEVIVRLAWRNVKFVEQPIAVAYQQDRVSHFRPLKDFARISVLNTFLFTAALLFYLPRLWFMNLSLSNLWKQVKNEFEAGSERPVKLAGAVGLGLFFGVFPIWGFQMLVAFAIASILRLNRLLVLFSSNISIPPFLPLILYFSFQMGSFFFKEPVHFASWESLDLSTIHSHVMQYAIGAVLLSALVGISGFAVTYLLSVVIRNRKPQ
ncbi:Glycosyltransferase involved in cell wall bisynthesis [Reichenbachiella faecimaris]|uniref:Glycosyltransferase involved in cell wall bisynthesis n=2 Tax=Reichenbachiella faecimaris TaxID=692418 RepID=A0A1W2G6D2_REIFA|nr:Glycosyltransferase involved in cell wall bisynthesis [Reichenbachiella faecimaris]